MPRKRGSPDDDATPKRVARLTLTPRDARGRSEETVNSDRGWRSWYDRIRPVLDVVWRLRDFQPVLDVLWRLRDQLELWAAGHGV